MKKAFIVIALAIITGVLFAKFIFKSYENLQVSKEINQVYFSRLHTNPFLPSLSMPTVLRMPLCATI